MPVVRHVVNAEAELLIYSFIVLDEVYLKVARISVIVIINLALPKYGWSE